MRNNIKLLLLIFTLSVVISCDKEDELIIFDSVNGQEALAFATASSSATVPPEGITVSIPVTVTTSSTATRTFSASEDATSTAAPGSFTIGAATIPAGSFEGTLDVSLNSSSLEDGILYQLVINLDTPAGGGTVFNEKTTINYNKKVICNDLELVINTDFWASETTWEVTDSTGAVVQSGGPYANGVATYVYNFNLPDGAYTLTFFDVYSDGMFDGTNTGDYTLTCSILTHATGGGTFGASESTDFVVNP